MDTTIPGIRFDASGECNFCKLHDKLEAQYPLDDGADERVRQIVEKNGGRIYMKNTKVGRGTTFTIEFPTVVQQEAKV